MNPFLLLAALLAALLAFAGAPFSSRAQAPTWQARTALPATGRVGAYSFVLNGTAYVGGGDANTGSLNDLWAYDATTDSWTARAALPAVGRGAASVFVLGGRAYVTCGESTDSSGRPTDLNDLWTYDPVTNTWTGRAPLPGPVRVGAYAFALGGKGYVGGGGAYATQPTQFTDCWVFDPATGQWTAAPAAPLAATTISASFALGGYGYVAGGLDVSTLTSSAVISQQVWRFDPTAQQWTQQADLPTPRAYAGCFTAGGYAYVAEGIENFGAALVPTHDVLRYDPAADTWTVLPPLPGASGRLVPFGFALGATAYAGSGQETTTGMPFNDFWALPNLLTGLPAAAPPAAFTLVPNPATGAVRLSGAPAGPVQVFDATGRLVRTASRAPGESETSLDLTGLTLGLYSVRCGTLVRRLVVE